MLSLIVCTPLAVPLSLSHCLLHIPCANVTHDMLERVCSIMNDMSSSHAQVTAYWETFLLEHC